MRQHERLSWLLLAACTALAASACGDGSGYVLDAGPQSPTATLVARAVLPAATFADGPAAGAYLGEGPINGQTVPFAKQPVQGFSGIVSGPRGTFLALSDNGFGTLESSADYHLRIYRLRPDFAGEGGAGTMEVVEHIELRDPGEYVPFTITNEFTEDRILTGADFDLESILHARDGTFWIGDEFGPFLLHFSSDGQMIEAPIPLIDFDDLSEDIRSPQNPLNEEGSAVRIMNAVRAHAARLGSSKTPVFSPYHVMLEYEGSDPDADPFRGANPPDYLDPAASDIFDIESIQAAGHPLVTWTVNDRARMDELLALGVNGIISDRPDLLYQAVSEFDANGDGTPGDYLAADGLIDPAKFDAQGHRGARDLRPENTLPAMEAALDNLMVTLETDTGITSDGVPVLSHEPYIEAAKCRRVDGADYNRFNQVLIKSLSAAEIQAQFICDQVIRDAPQSNDLSLSPVTSGYAGDNAVNPYVMPTLEQLLDFVGFYVDHYRSGAGSSHPDAAKRAANAERVRFNIETKLNPRSDRDKLNNVYKDRTVSPEVFADTVAGIIVDRGLTDRADIQSFDFRTLLRVQETQPDIRTVYLFGDFPVVDSGNSGDGTNLQNEYRDNTPWLGGMFWPYRVTAATYPFRLGRSSGLEGLTFDENGRNLLALLEKPLVGQRTELFIYKFDISERAFSRLVRYRYPLDSPDHAIGDFIMLDDETGLVIERDKTQGSTDAFKTIQRITLQGNDDPVKKELLVDLTAIEDPMGIAGGEPGDVGVGGGTFALPFETIGGLVVLGDDRLGVINDNNFPFSVGRHAGTGAPDDTELIVIQLSEPLIPPSY